MTHHTAIHGLKRLKRTHLCLLAALLLALPALSQEETGLAWPMSVQHRLDSMMRDPLLDTTQMGFMVWDLTARQPLFACNHRQLLRPASTMKLLTAITALDTFRPTADSTIATAPFIPFTTTLYYAGTLSGGTLRGDLCCVGGMDPMFDSSDMDSLVQAVKEVGVKRIVGRIVGDATMKDTLRFGEGWCWDDDNPVLTPLLVGRKAGFLSVLKSRLQRAGIDVSHAHTATGSLPRKAVPLCRRSHALSDVLLTMMKESDNLYAESMFYQVAAATGHRPARATDAARQERTLIERTGLPSSPYRLADGSGLSLYNYVSAELEVALLRHAYQQVHIYDRLLPTLPVAGVDGTLKKRMKGTAAEGNVQAKTGTVTGVITLAGYLTAASGHRLCFAILNQGTLRPADARTFQDKLCAILCE